MRSEGGHEANGLTAVILAGGLGTRIRHLLGELPKPMMPVAGRPFLEWVVRYFAKQGISRFVLATGYRGEAIEKHFAQRPVGGVEIVCARESEPLGTAGAFLNAVKLSGLVSENWLVANGDSLVLTTEFGRLCTAASEGTSLGVILGLEVEDAGRFGSLQVTPEGVLKRFAEKRPGAGLINAGVYAFRQQLLDMLPRTRPLSFETEVFPALLAEGHSLRVISSHGPFLDIGTEESLSQAEDFIRDHQDWFQRQ